MAISREDTIDDILNGYPGKAQALAQAITNAGLHCVGCNAATWETLEAGMYGHSMSDDQIDSLVKQLNDVLDEKEPDRTTITITPRAAEKYRSILKDEGKEEWGIRLTQKPGGCNGYEYVLDYSEKATEDDEVFQSEGLNIHISKKMLDKLLGSQIDYIDGLRGSGFKISNPNVRSACGCGSSHGY